MGTAPVQTKGLESVAASPQIYHPTTQSERTEIREQLERILASPLFRNSKRYPNLLRFTVERALEGPTEHLKERILGIEVFGRDPAYDTNLDPVVRITAVEVRKRLAQYYREPSHENEIRIDFPAGSYQPEFRIPAAPVILELPTSPVPLAIVTDPPRARHSGLRFLWPGAAAAAVCLAFWFQPWAPPTVLDQFWKPVLDSQGSVLVGIGGFSRPATEQTTTPISVREFQRNDSVALSDATTMSMLTGFFRMQRKPFRIRRGSLLNLADLREGPVVLIGGYNNPWTLRLLSQTRFHFGSRDIDQNSTEILDSQNPSHKWSVDTSVPYSAFSQDYALVSRVLDPTTGRLVVVAGGITRYGTLASGEFLTDPARMQELASFAPRGWNQKNVQIVLGTRVVGENSGPPRILATYFW
jgi:hypothetical protein